MIGQHAFRISIPGISLLIGKPIRIPSNHIGNVSRHEFGIFRPRRMRPRHKLPQLPRQTLERLRRPAFFNQAPNTNRLVRVALPLDLTRKSKPFARSPQRLRR